MNESESTNYNNLWNIVNIVLRNIHNFKCMY